MDRIYPNEIDTLRQAVKKLYYMQDKACTEEKLNTICQEIITLNVGLNDTLTALDNLCDSDIKSLKFYVIKAAILKYKKEVDNKIKCDCCNGEGLVTLVNEENYKYSFACMCPNGKRRAESQSVMQWNGQNNQIYNGKEFVIYSEYLERSLRG